MKRNIFILIILFILIATVFVLSKLDSKKQPSITEVPSRNDTAIIPESVSTSTIDKVYSIAEVNMHDKATDCWMVIGDKVIDATSFIASGKHPNDKILTGCGKDATEIFEGVKKHDESQAQDMMIKSQIGVLE